MRLLQILSCARPMALQEPQILWKIFQIPSYSAQMTANHAKAADASDTANQRSEVAIDSCGGFAPRWKDTLAHLRMRNGHRRLVLCLQTPPSHQPQGRYLLAEAHSQRDTSPRRAHRAARPRAHNAGVCVRAGAAAHGRGRRRRGRRARANFSRAPAGVRLARRRPRRSGRARPRAHVAGRAGRAHRRYRREDRGV